MRVDVGIVLGIAVVLLVTVLALRRPILARLGTLEAVRRPRQTIAIAIGLMFATTILGASSIAADSARKSFQDAISGRAPSMDFMFQVDRSLVTAPAPNLTRIAAIPFLRGHVVESAYALSAELPYDDDTSRMGLPHAKVWGINPADWPKVTGLEVEEGNLPPTLEAWSKDVFVVNRALANRLSVHVGDQSTLYLPAHPGFRQNVTHQAGWLVLSVKDPRSGDFVHSPKDSYTFQARLHNASSLRISATDPNATTDLYLTVAIAGGPTLTNTTGGPHPQLVLDSTDRLGTDTELSIRIDSPRAVNVSFDVTINVTESYETTARDIRGRVISISSDRGSDPSEAVPIVLYNLGLLQSALELPDRVSVALFSTDGTVHARTDIEKADINQDAQAASGVLVYVGAPKDTFMERADAIGNSVRSFFLELGSFTFAAAVVLMAVLLALLVEERKVMLAALRAVGAQRSDLTRMYLHEGSVYAVLAALVGLCGAAALVTFIGTKAGTVLNAGQGLSLGGPAAFRVVYNPQTLASILGFGFALTVIALAASAHRALSLDVAAALRGEEPVASNRTWVGSILLLVGLATTGLGAASYEPTPLLLGPVFLAFGISSLAGRVVNRHLAVSIGAFALTTYLIFTFGFLRISNGQAAFLVPLRAVILAVTASVVAAYSSAFHGLTVRVASFAKGAAPLVDTALSHLRKRPGRAALTMAMIATVLTVMTALGTMFASARPIVLKEDGGFPVIGESSETFEDARTFYLQNPPPGGVDPFPSMQAYVTVAFIPYGIGTFSLHDEPGALVQSRAKEHGSALVGVTPEAAKAWTYRPLELDPRFSNLSAALLAVAHDPSLVALSSAAEVEHFSGPGEFGQLQRVERVHAGMVLDVARRSDHAVHVVAVIDGLGSAGGFVHPSLLNVFHIDVGTRIYARPNDGTTSLQLTALLDGGFRRAAMQSFAVQDLGAEDEALYGAIRSLLGVFLGIGILVGMVGLAIVTARNVVSRHREIGMLRAIGAQRTQIIVLVGFETFYVTGMALVIGFLGGLAVGFNFVHDDPLLNFAIDWQGLLVLYALTLTVALATAMGPAWRAAKASPAEAVRYVE